MLHSEQKCAHFCSEWNILGYGTGAFWDLWNWFIGSLVNEDLATTGSVISWNDHRYDYYLNSLWPRDSIRWHRSGSTLALVMACCLVATSNYQNQCWLIISDRVPTKISEKSSMTFPWLLQAKIQISRQKNTNICFAAHVSICRIYYRQTQTHTHTHTDTHMI